MHRKLIVPAGVAVVVFFIAGCGGGGGTATASVTKAQFIKQADAICKKYSKQREAKAEFKKHRPNGYPDAETHVDQQLMEVAAPSLQEQAEELKALTPPEKDAARAAQMFENLERASEDIAAEGMTAVVQSSNLADFEDEAEAYGLKVCANP